MNEFEIFQSAVGIPNPSQRAAYVAKACGANIALKTRVEALLRAHQQQAPFLNSPAAEQIRGGPHEAAAVTQQTDDPSRGAPAGARPAGVEGAGEHFSFLETSSNPKAVGALGHYEILQVLGQGAFGIVFKAIDSRLQRLVAIKVLKPHVGVTSPPRKRFLREARAVAAIKHDNIIQVHSVEEHPLPYLVMEFIDGSTLEDKLKGTGPLEISEFLHVSRQLASGLAAAHARGLIHRDIKPANILLERGDEVRVKITDFGLARAADDASLTQSGMISGTPLYMSPEQAYGAAIDHRSDLFSLGSVMYVMASGRPPFRAANVMAVLERVRDAAPRPVKDVLPVVPQVVCDLIAKLQAKRPDDRFQSASEVAELLAGYLNQWKLTGNLENVPRQPGAASSGNRAHAGTVDLAGESSSRRASPAVTQNVSRATVALPRESSWLKQNRIPLSVAAGLAAVLLIAGATSLFWLPHRKSTPKIVIPTPTPTPVKIPGPSKTKPDLTHKLPPENQEQKPYTSLFNGTELVGMHSEGNANGGYRINHGVLGMGWRPNSDTSRGFTLYTKRNDYRNFRFRIETTAARNWACSMVFLWTNDTPRKRWLRAQIGTTEGRDVLETAVLRRSLGAEGIIAYPSTPVRIAKDQWFTQEVVVEGKRVRIYVDGVLRTETTLPMRRRSGHIGIALSGGAAMRIRKMEVLELPPSTDDGEDTPEGNGDAP